MVTRQRIFNDWSLIKCSDEMMKTRNINLKIAALFAGLITVHYVIQTAVILSGPRHGDLYAYSWSFQALSFSVSWLPLWLVALAVVLTSISRTGRNRQMKSEQVAPPYF
jgi:hypothetical protein